MCDFDELEIDEYLQYLEAAARARSRVLLPAREEPPVGMLPAETAAAG